MQYAEFGGPSPPGRPSEEQIREIMRRRSPPENELPVTVALNACLFRTDGLALFIGAAQVYRTGVTLRLTLRSRRSGIAGGPFGGPPHRDDADALRLGVEFSDGRSAQANGHGWPLDVPTADAVCLSPGGGGGSDRSWEGQYFLSPVPPPGPLTFHLLWESRGIRERSIAIDATPLAAAVADVIDLWPWEPPAPPPPRQPPAPPPGSWFNRG